MEPKYRNGGIAFKNKYKKSDKHPDWKGEVDIDGTRKEIAVWMRESAKGEYMSFAFSDPYRREAEPVESAPPPADEPEDALPF